MHKTKGIDFKKEYFGLLKQLSQLRVRCENDRCPPSYLGRNCCNACELMEQKIKEVKKKLNNEKE